MRSNPRLRPLKSLQAAPMQNLVEPLALALRASLETQQRVGQAQRIKFEACRIAWTAPDSRKHRFDFGQLLGFEADFGRVL